jgi:hypothetical protein
MQFIKNAKMIIAGYKKSSTTFSSLENWEKL